jgi:hypothetical protein
VVDIMRTKKEAEYGRSAMLGSVGVAATEKWPKTVKAKVEESSNHASRIFQVVPNALTAFPN